MPMAIYKQSIPTLECVSRHETLKYAGKYTHFLSEERTVTSSDPQRRFKWGKNKELKRNMGISALWQGVQSG